MEQLESLMVSKLWWFNNKFAECSFQEAINSMSIHPLADCKGQTVPKGLSFPLSKKKSRTAESIERVCLLFSACLDGLLLLL